MLEEDERVNFGRVRSPFL